MKSLLSRILLSGLLFISCMAVPAPLSLGETNQVSTGGSNVDCNLTANPDQCWRQKNQQTWTPTDIQTLPLNSNIWGLNGPLAASIKYDSDLAWILGLNYLHMFTDRLGLAAKATFGPNEWRGNLTAGYRHNDKHQVKLTYEYLNQNLPYDFETGTINSRVYQHAVGGAYQYLLQRGMLQSLEFSGIYTKANSKDLSGIVFYDGDDAWINLRRIAGGTEATGLASVNLLPFGKTSLSLGAGYSQVVYDTLYENDQNVSTVAFKAELNHVFHPTLKASASVNNTASSMEYNAKVSKILPRNFELSLGALRQESRGNLQNANSVVLGISYPAPKSYTVNNLGQSTLAELKNWIDKPVLYYNRVLAVRDQAIKKYAIASQPIPSQAKPIGQVIDSVETSNYFQFDPLMFDRVDYTLQITPSGKPTSPDMSHELNIVIAQKNNYDAVVSSVAPIPGGQNLEGNYNVTITAVGTKIGLSRPVTETRNFVLTVLYSGPGWTSKSLPAATLNTNYPYPDASIDLSKDSGTLKGYVITQDVPQDTYNFKILSGPSWVKLQDNHLLVADGLVQQSDTKPVTIQLQVTSNTLNESAVKDFQVQINAGAPVWSETLPDGQYGVVYPGANLNAYVKTPGETQTQYIFKPDQPLPAWLHLNSDTGALTGLQNIPSDASLDTQIYVTATDKKTNQSSAGVLTIHIKPGAPTWIDNTLPSAQQGVEYEQVDLAPKLRTAGLPNGDTYQMSLDSSSPKWLQITNGHFLTANGKVPNDAPDSVTVSITAHSEITGLNASQTFNLMITKQGAPIWNQTDLPNGQYGTAYTNFDLRKYVATPGNGTDQYEFTLNDNSSFPAWLQFNNGVIAAAPNSVIPEGAPSVVEIGVTVKSTVTNLSTPATLVMKILPGTPIWTDNTLPDAQQGVAYEGVDLAPKLHTPGLQKDTYTMALTGNSNPSWLQITNGHFLSANGTVPNDAPAAVAVTVTATSENAPGNLKATQTFNLIVTKPNAPIWIQTDLPNAQYNTTYTTTDLRQYVTTPGNSTDQYEFKLAPSSPPLPSWLDLNNGVLQGKQSIPESAPNVVEFQVIVKSTVTNAETLATLVINIRPGNPVWTDNTLPDAQQGVHYADVDLSTKLHTPGLRGDTYQMKLSGNPSWLKIENGTFLTGDVPSDAPLSVTFTVTATSQTNTALSSSQTFNLVVTKPGAPLWIKTDLPSGRYDAIYNSSTDLNTYVNTPNKPNEQYTFSPDQPLPVWLKLTNGHTLTGTQQAIPENTPTVVKLPITVTNTEGISTSGLLTINILPGAPIWSGNLSDAQYNVIYGGTNLLPLVRTPGTDSDSYAFKLDQGPSWLILGTDGHTLIGKSPVPEVDASPVIVKITATSSVSGLPSQQTFNIIIKSGAPVWTDNTLPDAQQGVVYIGADLTTKLHTPGLAKDTYTMSLEAPVSWLKVTSDGHLESDGPVPVDQTSPVTIKVTATSAGNTLSASQTFNLTITQAGAPIWSGTNLPDGYYNAIYKGSVDLKTLVSTPNNPSDTYTFNPDQPLPSWLTLNNGVLTGNQNVIPENTASVVKLPITVTNQKGISTPSELIINVRPGAPIWNGSLADAQYNVTYSNVDLLPLVRTPGMDYDNYQFKLDQAPSWLTIGADGHTLVGQAPVPEADASPVTVKITATSTTSNFPTQQTFSITIKSGAPVWTDNTLPDAQQGVVYIGADLTTKLHTPGLAKDTYTMNLEASVSWLKVTADGHLESNGPVPVDQTSPVTFKVTATSAGNTLSAPQTFTLTITQAGAPIWTGTTLPDGYYDAVYKGSVDLKTLVSTPNNPTDTYTFNPDQPLPTWLTLNNGVLTGNQNVIPETTATVVKLPITVTNQKGISTPSVLSINIRPGAPIWNGSLADAQYNVPYSNVDLLPLVRTPGMDYDNYQFTLDEHPSWLTIGADGHSLVGVSPVPETDASPITVKITATSVTSNFPTQQTFSITIKSGVPVWTDNTLPDAQQGIAYIGADLTTKLHTPGLAKDSYTMHLDTSSVSWLQVTADGHLQSVGTVPADQSSPVQFQVTATSAGNTLSAPQTFNLTVTPVGSPIWDITDLPDGNYGVVYGDGKSINLNDYVSTPGNINDQYVFAPAAGETLPSWLTLDPDGTIHGNGNIPESAPSIVKINVTVTGITGKSTTSPLQINIRPGAPIWTGDLPAAQYNTTYATTSLLPLVRTPGAVSDTYEFTIDPATKPSWLAVNGSDLIGQAPVPESATSPVTVKIIAKSTASQLSTEQTFSVTVNPGNPVWVDTTMPNAQQGETYPEVDLAPKLKTPGLPGDTYKISLSPNSPTWLTIGSDGHSIIGTGPVSDPSGAVEITVTATSQKTSGNLQSPPQTFTIDILDGLGWSGLNPDGATAGDTSYTYLVDNLVSCPPNQQCSVTLSNLPTWLNVHANPDGTTSLVSNQPVPAAAQDPSGTVSFDVAASTKSGQSLPPKTFSILINNVLPEWQDPATTPEVNFDGTSDPHLIHINSYITQGATNLAIKAGSGFDSANWKLVQEGTEYYLQRTTTGSPDDIGKQFNVPLIASNSTSQTPQAHTIAVLVTADSQLPGPDWSGDTPLDTTAGNSSYSYEVNKLITCPTGEQCTLTVTNIPKWLDLQVAADGTTTLVSNQVVPPAAQDPAGDVSFDVAVSSLKSGKTLPKQSFDIHITNVLPEWQDPATPPRVNFDGTSDPHLIHLNTYITQGAANLVISKDTGFDNTKWELKEEGAGDYYLERLPGSSDDDIGQVVNIPLVASNSTSHTPQPHTVKVQVIPNSALPGPEWNSNTPIATTAGNASYSYVVNQLVTCPTGDQCPVKVSNVPAWLDVQVAADGTTTLVSNQVVPPAATDPAGTVSFDLEASSLKSGNKLLPQTFNIQITNVLPKWQDPATPPDVIFDGTSDPIHLNPYITAGTANLVISKDSGFDNTKWKLDEKTPGDYYLERLPGNSDDIGQTVSIPLVATNSTSQTPQPHAIKVQVIPDAALPGPEWNTNKPSATTAGDASYSYVVNQLVTCPTGDHCPVKVSNVPAWLDVQVAADGTTTLVSNQVVPPAATDPSGTVSFDLEASSLKSGNKLLPQTFNIQITNVLPQWQDPATPPDVIFDGTSDPIHLNPYITAGTANLVISKDSGFDNTKWKLDEKTPGDYYLERLPGNSDDIGQTVSIPLVATNSTSQTPQPHAVKVQVIPDAALPGPEWNTNKPSATTAGDASYSYVVNQLVTCPTGDQCPVKVSNVPAWLDVQVAADGTTTLVSNQVVPPAATDPSGTVSFDLEASSVKSGNKLLPQTFNIQITNVLPKWQDPATPPTVNFDGTSDLHLIHLNTYISEGTTNLVINKGAGFDANKWQLIKENTNDYYLQRLPGSVDDIGTKFSIPVVASNSTSQTPQPHDIEVVIGPNAALGAPQKQADILNASMGYPYTTVDLNSIFKAPVTGDTLSYSFTATGAQPWLDIQPCTIGGNASTCLVAKGDVPLSDDTDFTVTIHAYSKASGDSINQPLTAQIIQQHPGWIAAPSGTVQFNNIDPTAPAGRIELDQFITSNTGNQDGSVKPPLSFKMHDAKDRNWVITQDPSDQKYYLSMTAANPAYNNATLVGKEVSPDPQVDAYNNTSSPNAPQTKTINVVTTPDAGLPGPSWTGQNPVAATAGSPMLTYSYALANLFSCQANDYCEITLDLSDISWLQSRYLNGTQEAFLENSLDVPLADTDPFGLSAPFTVTITSLASGHSISKQFAIQINNVLPEWDQTAIPGVNYNGTSPDNTIHLNDYIKAGTAGLNFVPGTNFDPDKWQIINPTGTTDYYLKKLAPGNPNEIGATPATIPVLAKNTTSLNGKEQGVSVNILPDANLPLPSWVDSVLPAAQMGQLYGDGTATPIVDLNKLVTTSGEPNDSFTFSFDSSSITPPSWLSITNGHLVSTGNVPNDDAMPASFSVVISAKSLASGLSKSYTFSNVPINQTLPGWDSSADYKNWSITYDDTDKGIKLGPYITSGNTNLTFSFPGNQITIPNWQIVLDTSDNNYYLRRTTSATDELPSDIGNSITLNLVAHNSTSTNASQEKVPQLVTINVLPDSSKQPIWKPNATIPSAYMGYAYGDNNADSKTGVVDLASQDRISTPGITNDTYTFSFDPSVTPPAWLIFDKTQGSLLISDPSVNNGNVPTTATDFPVAVIATSKATGNTAKVTFNVSVLPTLPKWQNVTQSTTYFDDLSTSVPTTAPNLTSWIDTTTNKGIAFQIDPSDPTKCATNFVSANWKLSPGTATISRTTSDISDIYDGTNSSTIVRIPVLASNATSPQGTGTEQCIPVEVQPRPGNKPTWNSKTLPPIYGTFTYPKDGSNIDLGTYLNDNGNSAFTCKLDDNSAVSWMKISNNQQLSSNGAIVPPIDARPSISVQCQSQKTGQWTDVPSPGAGLFTIDVAPVLKSPTDVDIPGIASILFDDVSAGINLQNLMASGRMGAAFTLQSTDTNYKPANWTVKLGVLLRQLVNGNNIDASDLATNSGRVQMNLKVTNTTSTGLSDSNTYTFTVQPDPNVVYKFSDGRNTIPALAAEPQQAPSVYSTSIILDSSSVHAFMPTAKGGYQVMGDSGYSYTPVDTPKNVDLSTIPKIGIRYASINELSTAQIPWNLGISSVANSGNSGTKVVSNMIMPPLLTDAVVLVPPTNPGTSGVMTLGTSYWESYPYQDRYTTLQLNLGANKRFLVQQIIPTSKGNYQNWHVICPGAITQLDDPNKCPNNLADNATFSTDGSTTTVTFLLNAVDNLLDANPGKQYPVFETAPNNLQSKSANIILKLQ